MPQFNRCIGIDYSGAKTPDSSCKGLRVYCAKGSGTPEPVRPRKCHRRRHFPEDDRDGDEQAAYAATAWLQRADRSDFLSRFLSPSLTPEERGNAAVSGWILGVV